MEMSLDHSLPNNTIKKESSFIKNAKSQVQTKTIIAIEDSYSYHCSMGIEQFYILN